MLIELPGGGHQEQLEPRHRERVHPLSEVDAGAGALRAVRLPAGQPAGRRGAIGRRRSSRRVRASSRSTTSTSAAGGTPTRSGSTRSPAAWSRSSRLTGARPLASATRFAGASHSRTEGESRNGPLPRFRHDVSQRHRRAADCRARLGVARRRARRGFWYWVTQPEAVAALKLTLAVAGARRADERGLRNADRVDARARRLPRQAASQRDHRPAVRAADDRRRPARARALRARLARARRRRLHPHGDLPRAALRHACRSSCARCSRCSTSSTRTWKRLRGRSARARSWSSAASSCRASCRAFSPASRWRSRARSARSGRSRSSPATGRSAPRSPPSTSSTRARAETGPAQLRSPSLLLAISFVLLLGVGGLRFARDEARACVG